MRIFKIFLWFWLPTVVVLILSVFSIEKTQAVTQNVMPTLIIIQRNFIVLLLIWASGFLNKYLPYLLFGFNSVFFSFVLTLSGDVWTVIIDVLKYGVIEVFSFSIALSIAGTMKINFLASAGILLVLAAFLENLVMRGVL